MTAAPSLNRVLVRQVLIAAAIAVVLQSILMLADYALEREESEADLVERALERVTAQLVPDASGLAFRPDVAFRHWTDGNVDRVGYAIRDAGGRLVAELAPHLLSVEGTLPSGAVDRWSLHAGDRLLGGARVTVGGEPASVLVSLHRESAGAGDWLLAEAVEHVGLPMLPLVVLTLLLVTVGLRRALRPVRAAAAAAAAIDPKTPRLHLPEAGLPREIRDLTETVNRALERVADMVDAQRAFTAHAAHELRTPLAILTLAIDELPAPEGEALRRDVDRMNRLVDQLLAAARAESGIAGSDSVVVLGDVVDQALEATLRQAERRRIRIATDVDRTVALLGDANALVDAARNLLENAIRHARDGGTVRISVTRAGVLQVEDDGPGIPEADRAVVTQAFRKSAAGSGGGSGSGSGDGVGLGLAIVARVAAAHGGRVVIARSELGGAAVGIAFPASAIRPACDDGGADSSNGARCSAETAGAPGYQS